MPEIYRTPIIKQIISTLNLGEETISNGHSFNEDSYNKVKHIDSTIFSYNAELKADINIEIKNYILIKYVEYSEEQNILRHLKKIDIISPKEYEYLHTKCDSNNKKLYELYTLNHIDMSSTAEQHINSIREYILRNATLEQKKEIFNIIYSDTA
jgi:hypothetical protein